jgi:outer membrane lipoprotein-sorting protein
MPVASVVYNPEINQALELSLVKSFELTAGIGCIKFSRDGNYFSVALSNEETHICDTLTMSSKR